MQLIPCSHSVRPVFRPVIAAGQAAGLAAFRELHEARAIQLLLLNLCHSCAINYPCSPRPLVHSVNAADLLLPEDDEGQYPMSNNSDL